MRLNIYDQGPDESKPLNINTSLTMLKCTYAIITDIHGNIFALQKALEVIDREIPDAQVVCLGDCFSLGASPKEVLQILQDHPEFIFVRGNHDRYLLERIWEYDRPTVEGMDPDDPVNLGVVANQKWTAEQIGQEGIDFIRKMRISFFESRNHCHVEFTHAWFERDDQPPSLEEALNWREHAQKRHPEIQHFVLVHGHIHIPRMVTSGSLNIFCPGSTGMPFDEDQQGAIGVLTMENGHPGWSTIRFEYDVQKAINHMQKVQPPFYRNLIATLQYASIRNDLA